MEDTRRTQIIEMVQREFIGPDPIDLEGARQTNGEEILRGDPPRTRYIAGILYPRETEDSGTTDAETEETDAEEEEEDAEEGSPGEIRQTDSAEDGSGYMEDAEELINSSNAFKPSAMSLTVSVRDGDSVTAEVSAGTYTVVSFQDPKTGKKGKMYPRDPVRWSSPGPLVLPGPRSGILKMPVTEDGLQFDVTYRQSTGEGRIFTFTLENTRTTEGGQARDTDCFYQCQFTLRSETGFSPLAEGQRVTKDEDYLSNQLLYRNVHSYAIGHGCAADWEEGEKVTWISTAVLPACELKPIVPASIPGVSLEMLKMSRPESFGEALQELKTLCDRYGDWIDGQSERIDGLEEKYRETARRHVESCRTCLGRMRHGLGLLESNDQIRTAFQYMNRAMLMQQIHYALPLQTWESAQGDIFLSSPVPLPDESRPETWYDREHRVYGRWRPFQIAFILMNLESMYSRSSPERETVDLIWFPTGGGKTEAYLGLSAFTIFIRRLQDRSDGGTAVIMRYTLRLLTAQQYERASAMICACEKIRGEREDLFGKTPITIGLWVGGETTPNTEKDAVSKYQELYRNGDAADNPFVMHKCPWCGAQMGPVAVAVRTRRGNRTEWRTPGYVRKKLPRGKLKFAFQCGNRNCDFSKVDLPLTVVDEEIYEHPPTVLLGTVDKFAMLPFRPEAKSIFGYRKNGSRAAPPDLIIQDELHLISGPLGSMVGHYETMIHELCTAEDESRTVSPKVIASTATISRAREQCHALYGCGKDHVFQFPPPGLDAGDSFFAREDREQNGRLYVGVLADGASSFAMAAIRVYATLLYAAKAMEVEDESQRDPYWTNVGYYNSIRELGQASSWIRADVEQQLDVLYKRRGAQRAYATKEEYRASRRYIWRDEELTSRISGSEVTESLSQLNVTYPPVPDSDGKIRERPIDICLATNMISVGLDVPRLGLMTVTGQPKTTSEYIQATSRVGRDAVRAPGIVFVLYRPGMARDKSHYEQFRSYHSRLYCSVEPTSVTPFSGPVRDRALHAVLFGLMRLEGGDSFASDPLGKPDKGLAERICGVIKERVEKTDPEELEDTEASMQKLLKKWDSWSPERWEAGRTARGAYTEELPLMYWSGKLSHPAWDKRGFPTPTSMRNVDRECSVKLLDEYISWGG